MTYITRKRARFRALTKTVNLPYGTELPVVGDFLSCDGVALCTVSSEMCHRFFVENSDGKGAERGRLVEAILKTLQRRDADYQKRWDKVWGDKVSEQYRRKDHEDHWLWDHSFYSAPIPHLRHIAALVGAKVRRE